MTEGALSNFDAWSRRTVIVKLPTPCRKVVRRRQCACDVHLKGTQTAMVRTATHSQSNLINVLVWLDSRELSSIGQSKVWSRRVAAHLVWRVHASDASLSIPTRFRELSNFEEGTECEISHYYKDEDTMRLVNAMANIIGSWQLAILN